LPEALKVEATDLTLGSGIMLLHDHYISSRLGVQSGHHHRTQSADIIKETARQTMEICKAFLDPLDSFEEISPMVLHSSYGAATVYIRLIREEPSQALLQDLDILKRGLQKKNQQWRAARTFICLKFIYI
jgi:hypothetical protein